MNTRELNKAFKKAVEKVRNYTEPLPADLLLRLYAYYKIATKNNASPRSKNPLINAFKTNALFQARNVDEKEAKERYVDLVDHYLNTIAITNLQDFDKK
jgi:diazepam-binding inhibitor (GABA receptor modulator, acyl-CoA-binding protein)